MSRELPRVEVQPVVRDLDLVAVDDLLLEDAVAVAQAVAPSGEVQRGQGVQETRSQATEAAVAQRGVVLLLDDILDPETEIREAVCGVFVLAVPHIYI
jgi:hypothetical protein